MKLYVNRSPISGPYGGGNQFVKAIHKLLPDMGHELLTIDNLTTVPDVVLIAGIADEMGSASVEQLVQYKMFMQAKKDVKLVIRVNENDARKRTTHVDDMLLKLSGYVDGTVFVSNWLKDYFVERGWKDSNTTVIVNGVDAEVFKHGAKIDNGGKVNIVSCHWSDNYMKGQDYTEWLDDFVGKNSDQFTFTFIGRTQAQLKNSKLIRPMSGKRLGEELGKYDVCINASRFDPGPNGVIEPISCGLHTYVHKDGGGAVEFAGTDHVFSSFDELEALLKKKKFTPNTTRFEAWDKTVESYSAFLKSVQGSSSH